MSVWLGIISGLIGLLNRAAARLQQQHDELNGRRAQNDENKSQILADVEKINSAGADPGLSARVREQSSRD